MFSYIYHVLYSKIKTGRILKGVITSLVIFSAYILALFFYLDSSKLDYIKLYLLFHDVLRPVVTNLHESGNTIREPQGFRRAPIYWMKALGMPDSELAK